MTALAAMQQDWMVNWDNKQVTGILLWDLLAAFDMLCLQQENGTEGIKLEKTIRSAKQRIKEFCKTLPT